MRIPKLLTVAALALTMGALTAPAASAEEWTSHGEPLAEEAAMTFVGVLGVQTNFGIYECVAEFESTIMPGEKGLLNALTLKTATCKGTKALATCTLKDDKAIGGPWAMQATPLRVDIKKLKYELIFEGVGCPPKLTVAYPDATFTPDNLFEMASFTFSGAAEVEVFGMPVSGEGFGEFSITPAGTLGLN